MSKGFIRVRISDIAQLSGVSPGTVDRVIHNRGEVSGKTHTKVMEVLKEMNYEPDIFASTLASKRSFRFAAILPEASNTSPFWEIPKEGLESALNDVKSFGIKLEKSFFPYHDKVTFEKQLNHIVESRPDGVIMTPVFIDIIKDYLYVFTELNIPVVFLNTQVENMPNLAFVGQDTYQSGMVAGRILDFGLQLNEEIFIMNIIKEEGANTHILSREKGFREYFDQKYGGCCKKITTININTQKSNEIEDILSQHLVVKNPDDMARGVFVTNSRVFIIANYISRKKLKNIRLIGYDLLDSNIEFLRNNTIDFLISQNPYEQGYRSFMTLFNKLVMKKEVIKNQFLPIDIITKENIDFYLKN